MNFRTDYYEILEVHPKASQATIDTVYRRKRSDLHPDKHPNAFPRELDELNAKSALLNEAYKVLSNSDVRRKYDEFLNEIELRQHGAHTDSRSRDASTPKAQGPSRGNAHGAVEEPLADNDDSEDPDSEMTSDEYLEKMEQLYQAIRKWILIENQPMIIRIVDEFRVDNRLAKEILERMYR